MARTLVEIDADITAARAAIASCLQAASYGIAGRTKSMSLLPHLKAHLHELISERNAADGGSKVTYPGFASKT
jgi:hypothetical protein